MASNTPNLNLLKKDPVTDGNDTFNIQTMLNDNWDKIDAAVGEVREELHAIEIPYASLTVPGIVQLSNETNGTRENVAATELAMGKVAVQLADKASKTYVDAKPWQKHKLTDDSGRGVDISGTDLDSLFTNGQYFGTSLYNTPVVGNWFYVEVFGYLNTNFCMQRVTVLENSIPTLYMRMRYAGAWGAWSPDLFQSGVNAKISIADAVNAKGVPASANDTWSSIAAKIGQISVSGRFAKGTIISSADTIIVERPNSTQSSVSVVTYIGLTFMPRVIFLTSGSTIIIYSSDINYGGNFAADILVFTNNSVIDYKFDGPLVVTSSGFSLPVPGNLISTSFFWWAYD
ncbi:tail fiber-like repeat protein [Fontibacillus phaseoli]|uniref:Tail fiber-like repeat protein n=1 Tax=Fontibacillus phaseoli TaxID=1416533 RepID=A0A369BPT1_9BACL|nr:pyocin knob domain-containing protein [Fontibacillus phaseoli]RCX22616.1 tail fiber-like repeat protein [Fontibacillus phaseoli]